VAASRARRRLAQVDRLFLAVALLSNSFSSEIEVAKLPSGERRMISDIVGGADEEL
jgi:hypothetical protein